MFQLYQNNDSFVLNIIYVTAENFVLWCLFFSSSRLNEENDKAQKNTHRKREKKGKSKSKQVRCSNEVVDLTEILKARNLFYSLIFFNFSIIFFFLHCLAFFFDQGFFLNLKHLLIIFLFYFIIFFDLKEMLKRIIY